MAPTGAKQLGDARQVQQVIHTLPCLRERRRRSALAFNLLQALLAHSLPEGRHYSRRNTDGTQNTYCEPRCRMVVLHFRIVFCLHDLSFLFLSLLHDLKFFNYSVISCLHYLFFFAWISFVFLDFVLYIFVFVFFFLNHCELYA